MKRVLALLFKIHRITGTAISGLFLMWFLSGLVLIYHPYPKVSESQLNSKMESLPRSLPHIDSIREQVSGTLRGISLTQSQGQTLFTISTKDTTIVHTLAPFGPKPLTFSYIESVARHWVNAPIARVDTLHQREQWVLFTKYDNELPIYKFYFDDDSRHQLFISSRTAEVLQMTTLKDRFWAWIGAIPHKMYIPLLRRNVTAWQNTIATIATICLVAALSGLVLGLWLWVKRYRSRRVWQNPYKKRWYRWHFAYGLVFGLFLVGWATSGIFTLQRVPQWIVSMEGDYTFRTSRLWGSGMLRLEDYRLDYRQLKEQYPNLKQVEWVRFGDIPAYSVVEGECSHLIDASGDSVKPLQIPEEKIVQGLKKIYGDEVAMKTTLIDEFDNYYLSRRVELELPVYKIEIDDGNGTLFYVNPATGYVRYLNNNKIVRKWLYNGIHYLDIDWLVERQWLWSIAIWVLCAGCIVVCVSGFVLGCKLLVRKCKRLI